MDLETIFQGQMTQYKWNMLGQYLKGQIVHPGKGIRLENSASNGISIAAEPRREVRPSQAPPFSVLSCEPVSGTDPQQYKVTLQEGWVFERHTLSAADGVQEHEPTIGGAVMSTRPRPPLTVESGDFIACQYDTDTEGFITGVPQIIAGADQASAHHQPPSGEGDGAVGNYFCKLVEFQVVEGAPTFIVYQQSDIEHSRLPTIDNIGEARYLHKQWNGDTDRYEFRTLEQVPFPSPRVGGKVIVDANGDEFLDANDAIKFSCIVGRLEPEIIVNDDGAGVIEITGNSNNSIIGFERCDETLPFYRLTFSDGLFTGESQTIKIPDCGDVLPSGTIGEILYHDGTDWVTLPNPGVPALEAFVLTHDGTIPSWTDTDTP